MTPTGLVGYWLLHQGTIALSQAEAHGMRIDVPYLKGQLERAPKRMREIQNKLQSYHEWEQWTKRFGAKSSLGSDTQIAEFIYKILGYPVLRRTDKGNPSTDIEALEGIDLPFIRGLLRYQKLKKALEFLNAIDRELVGDRIHPFFHLHVPVTYRSSSSNPNFQNFPVRDPEIAAIIRRCFIASEGCCIVENDFKGIEVGVAACYHKDPTMMSYLRDKSKDMHGDMAGEIYFLEKAWIKQKGKNHRYGAKNKFVFPEFYGDWYKTCAQSLWEWMERAKLKGPDEIPLKQHLALHGITGLGDLTEGSRPQPGEFTYHIQKIEKDFWYKRFPVYTEWKEEWWQAYLKNGYFDTFTGFRIEGMMKRNQAINYPVQGCAFHCLLWSFIQITKQLRHYRLKSRLAGQVHDSTVGDVRVNEVRDYLDIVRDVIMNDLPKAYPWLIVPLEVETEIAPPTGTWYDKVPVEYNGKTFDHEPKGGAKVSFESSDDFLHSLDIELAQKLAS